MHHSFRSCLLPFYTILIFPLSNRSFTCLLSFFCCTLHIKFYTLRNIILPGAIYCCLHTCCVYVVLSEVCYQLSLLIWASYRHFKERLPEAICCCLQTCNVDVVLLVMYCMYIPAFIVTILLIYCLRLFVVVYKLVMFTECG